MIARARRWGCAAARSIPLPTIGLAPNPLRADRDGLVSRTPWGSDDRAQLQPQLLDPERELRDDREDMRLEEHRISARRLDAPVHARCGYAEQRWTDVARVRQYRYDDLPLDPRRAASERGGTSPTEPDGRSRLAAMVLVTTPWSPERLALCTRSTNGSRRSARAWVRTQSSSMPGSADLETA